MSGYKDFVAGDPLTAAQVDGYLMRQSVMVFASASARDAALSGVLVEGMTCYISDTNLTTTYDGAAWSVTAATAATYDTEVFTASGTFTKATYPWARAIRVRVVGGGGGGEGSTVNDSGGPGGGSGGYAESRILVSALGATETVTVGSGGVGNTGAGADGGNSSFGAHAVAGGGNGGGNAVADRGGDGGNATTGDIQMDGNPGGNCGASATYTTAGIYPGGHGGGSAFGGGGIGSAARLANANGGDGKTNTGGGGGGGYRRTADVSGGDGADGIVIVEIYA